MTEQTQQCLIVFVGLVMMMGLLAHYGSSCTVATEETRRKTYVECFRAGKTAAECKLIEIAH